MTTVLQINTNGAVPANDLLTDRVSQGYADVSLVSVQYRYRARSTTTWFADDSDMAAVWIAGRHRSKITGRGKEEGFVWARVGGVTYVSVYISPNLRRNEFLRQVERMEDVLRDISRLLLVAGDFNARAIEWGMPEMNSKGRDLFEMAARLGLVVANEGSVTTYRRPGFGESIPDVTLASEQLVPRISNWQVLEEETGSDHQYISFTVLDSVGGPRVTRPLPRWNTHRLNKDRLIEELRIPQGAEENDLSGREEIETATNQRTGGPKRSWNYVGHISGFVDGHSARGNDAWPLCLTLNLNRHRKDDAGLSRRCWKEVCDEVNADSWGIGYKIITRRIGAMKPLEIKDAR